MKQRRPAVLLVVMVALIALQWLGPPASTGTPDVAQAIVRPAAQVPSMAGSAVAAGPAEAPARAGWTVSLDDLSAGTRDMDAGEGPRNAFAVRTAPAPVAVPLPPQPVRVAAVQVPVMAPAAPSSPPLPLPPPLQVIGSWRDAQGASVFVGGPRGVLHGRVGDVLLNEYRITQITPQQVLLQHLPSNRQIPLTVPANAATSLALSK